MLSLYPKKKRFVVDRRIFVVGFGLYGSIHGPSEYQVTIQLYHTSSGRLLGTNETGYVHLCDAAVEVHYGDIEI